IRDLRSQQIDNLDNFFILVYYKKNQKRFAWYVYFSSPL
ncbi:hypothetical protein CEXT_31761, partial [Caerostris extrusa]